MRLLLVSQDFPPAAGGIQTFAGRLAECLSARGVDLDVIAPKEPAAAEYDRSQLFAVHRLAGPPPLLGLVGGPAIGRLARRRRPDASFHAQWQTAAAALAARRLWGFPRRVVVAAHGRELLQTAAGLYGPSRRRVLLGADALCANSRYTAGLLAGLGVPTARIRVVHCGTDPDRFRPDRSPLRQTLGLEGRRVAFSLCRLLPHKGIDTALRALARTRQRFPDLAYVIGGTGPDRPRLEAVAADLGLTPHVRFAGPVPDAELVAHYNLGDFFVLPSRSAPPAVEGFGIAFLEAGACAKPVIGARTGGIPDAVDEDRTGLLVPPADDEALARAFAFMCARPDAAARMGLEGRRRVLAAFTWDHVADRVLAALEGESPCPSC